MKFSKRQKLFIAITPIATVVTICSHINVLGLPLQTQSQSPNSALLTLVADNKQTDTSEEIGRACLPSMEAAGAKLIGEYQNPTTTQLFQVWMLYITPNHPVLRIHGLYGTTCLLAYDERYDDTIGENVSEEDAKQVALVVWKYRANEVGGIEALQTVFDNQAIELEQYGEVGYVSVEEKWALEALGIQIPSVIEIYDPENPPQPTRSERGEI